LNETLKIVYYSPAQYTSSSVFLSVFFVRSNVHSSESEIGCFINALHLTGSILAYNMLWKLIPLVYWESTLISRASVCAGWMKCHHIGLGSKG
jgi:hypothetical protein